MTTKNLRNKIRKIVKRIEAETESDEGEGLEELICFIKKIEKQARFNGYVKGREEGINLYCKIKGSRIAVLGKVKSKGDVKNCHACNGDAGYVTHTCGK